MFRVNKKVLISLAGIMWMLVGIYLQTLAFGWLSLSEDNPYGSLIIGIVAALIIHHFGFLNLATKNLKRIDNLSENPYVLSFISWKSYLIIVIMMSLGSLLRNSPLPKQYLAVLYIGIGLALFLSSIRYFRNLLIKK